MEGKGRMDTSSILQKEIQSKIFPAYQIIGMQDLSIVSSRYHYLYSFLDSVYRPAFTLEQKIVFYSCERPSKDLLIHLQSAVRSVDISNWFISLICPGDLNDDLEFVRVNYSTDNHAITHIPCKVEDADPMPQHASFQIPETICPLPWEGLKIHANGAMVPCCVYQGSIHDDQGHTVNINSHSIDEYYRSEDLNNLRQSLALGQRPQGCSNCWIKETSNMSSTRTYALSNFGNKFYAKSADDIGVHRLRSLDLAIGNLCNLKCNICNWQRSSQIAAEKIKQQEELGISIKKWNKDSLWIEKPESLDQIDRVSGNLDFLEFEGGEPFFHNYHLDVLKKISQQRSCQGMRIRYNTNGTVFLDARALWKNFKETHICFSIDDIGQRFEYQRTNATWEKVSENLDLFNEIRDEQITMSFYVTVSIQNVFYLPELIAELDSYGWPINFNLVTGPISLSIFEMTPKAKTATLEKLKRFLKMSSKHHDDVSNLVCALENMTPTDGRRFVRHMLHIDFLRGRNFADAHPEMAGFMDYNIDSTVDLC